MEDICNMYIQLSKYYTIRNEYQCSYLIRIDHVIGIERTVKGVIMLPPFLGHILANIGRYEIDVSCIHLSDQLNVKVQVIKHFIKQLITAECDKEFEIGNGQSVFLPQYLLVEAESKDERIYHTTADFDPCASFVEKRPFTPINANLMVTTKCTTNCIYCYAQRNLGDEMTTDILLETVRKIHEGGIVNLALTGGDIFARTDWPVLLKAVNEKGYKPFLSTKTVLSENDLFLLKKLGHDEIQFSLDSIEPEILTDLVAVKSDYINKVDEMFMKCDVIGIKVQVRSVLTKYNSALNSIKELYAFLSQHLCIKEWDMTPAFFSEYKQDTYKDYEVPNEALVSIYDFTHSDKLKFPIRLNKIRSDGYKLKRFDSVNEFVSQNQICMGNTYSISILATGKCTVCEMLYQHEEYLLGDVKVQSIQEIWNSERAWSLYIPDQSKLKAKDTPCADCNVFDICKKSFGKRVCYVDIAKTKGNRNGPDPRCPLAIDCHLIL